MHQSSTLYVGLDVHTESIAGAYVAKEYHAEVVAISNIGIRQGDIDTLVRQLQSKRKHLAFVYEAGPCGYWLYRRLSKSAFSRRPVFGFLTSKPLLSYPVAQHFQSYQGSPGAPDEAHIDSHNLLID